MPRAIAPAAPVRAKPAAAARASRRPAAASGQGTAQAADIAAMRAFNRFYTARLRLLDASLLHSGLTLPEARVVWELAPRAQHAAPAAATPGQLAERLELDAGYLSRLLGVLQRRRLIRRRADPADARQQRIELTPAGQRRYAALDAASSAQLALQTSHLAPADCRELLAAMQQIRRLLDPGTARGHAPAPSAASPAKPPAAVAAGTDALREPFVLRDPEVGDLGYVVHRQAVLYALEYGWNTEFEALVAEIVAGFVRHFDAKRERCWIAEQGHRIVGSVFLVRVSDEEAKLRLLYVEASTRGSGLGGRLVDACIRDARAKGYRRLTLWTNDVLVSARKIYLARGFTLEKEERHHAFGHDLVGQHWALVL